jgi:hypothetical protein
MLCGCLFESGVLLVDISLLMSLTANYSNLVVIYRDGTFRHAQ